MDYLGDNAGLTTEQTEKVLQFNDLTGIDDISICRDVLQRHQWNLEVAVQEQLNIREVDLLCTQPKHDPLPLLVIIWSTFITNPLEDVLQFIRLYEEKYSDVHPVFYQGTYSQVLNDAKHELKFLLIYLHNDNAVDTGLFCRNTLSNPDVITFINTYFLFWGCSSKSGEGYKVCQLFRPGHYPYLAVVVLKDNRMTIAIFYFVFCHPNAPDSFEITTNFPNESAAMYADKSSGSYTNARRSWSQHREVLFINDLTP
ncbi:hypothetical protein FQR65_LT19088 [Abscondita terminalis]|nr:hypothetical protein FQR65_LT19088 [Abscondita terminalis]